MLEFIFAIVAPAVAPATSISAGQCTVEVGKDGAIALTVVPSVRFLEPHISAHPIDKNSIMASAIRITTNPGGQVSDTQKALGGSISASLRYETVLYQSSDSGTTWREIKLGHIFRPPDDKYYGHPPLNVDPLTEHSLSGRSYFQTFSKDIGNFLYFSRVDGKWVGPVKISPPLDHPMWVVDRSRSSKYYGNIYLVGTVAGSQLQHDGRRGLILYRSTDDGLTWKRLGYPSEPAEGDLAPVALDVLASTNGSIFVSFVERKTAGKLSNVPQYSLAVSHDGGKTFTQNGKYILSDGSDLMQRVNNNPSVAVAIDTSSSSFADVVYLAWVESDGGTWRLQTSYSQNSGRHWTAPVTHFSEPRSKDSSSLDALYYRAVLPSIDINKQGHVFVSWYQFYNINGSRADFDRKVSVSVDGGRTFLRPVSLSSAVSRNARYLRLMDYLSASGGADGTMHFAWMDQRNGQLDQQEIWHGSARVRCPDER